MNPKDRTEGSPPTATGMDADVTTADRRKSSSKHPVVESATGTAERNLLEQILAPENLNAAWKRVRRNRGAPGVDGITIEAYAALSHEQTERLRQELFAGRYRPMPVRRVLIPKPDGTERPLGVPTVQDRLIQQAVAQVLTPLSPLLANIVLDPLDKELERRGHRFARYADDFIVMVKSARAAQRVMASLVRYVEGRLKLVVNPAKYKTAPLKECSFLSFQITGRGKVVWTVKAARRFKLRLKTITSRKRGVHVDKVIVELRRYVIGWLGYFGISNTYKELLALEDWMRRRVRLYYWKQWKQPRTRRRNLIKLGANPKKVKLASRSRKGYWRMSSNSIVQAALNNAYLHGQGVPDMRAKWIAMHYGNDGVPA